MYKRQAKDWVKNASTQDMVKPWDKKGFKLPGGNAYHPAGFMSAVGTAAMVHHNTKGAYQNQSAMLSVMYEAGLVDFDTALQIEARWFTKVLMNPSSTAMIRSLFINKQALEKGANRPKNVSDLSVKKLGIIGAGLMGAGIAYVAARAGIEVVLLDQNQESAEKGKAYSSNILDKAIARKRSTEEKKQALLANITPTSQYSNLQGCDLVVEAVFEDMKVKADATQLAEAQLDDKAIFATNTSTLPISDLAKASKNADRFIGIHFFSPVDKMPLAEIIAHDKTSDQTISTTVAFAKKQGKTPIVVKDKAGFYVNRILAPYMNEAAMLLLDGYSIEALDKAMVKFGFPVGPMQLLDEVGIDVGSKIGPILQAELGERFAPPAAFSKLIDDGRLGKKANKGFYQYNTKSKSKKKQVDESVYSLLDLKVSNKLVSKVQVERCVYMMLNEAARCLDEGIVRNARDGDIGAIFGIGFPPFLGGPFQYICLLYTSPSPRD